MVEQARIPVVNIELGKSKETKIVFLGDVHYGHESCAKEEFQKTIDWIKKNNAKVICMGDLIEISVENHLPGSMYSQLITPNTQRKEVISMLSPIKENILGIITGNHEISRGWKLNSIDPSEVMAESLNASFWGDGGYVIINLLRNKKVVQTYNLLLFHGDGMSTTPEYLVNKVLKIYPDADMLAVGHSHILACGSSYFLTINQEKNTEKQKRICWIRTGSYLSNARYAKLKFYPPGAIGSPIVTLLGNEKKVIVDTETLEYLI